MEKRAAARIATKCDALMAYLAKHDNILFLTTSTRYIKHPWDIPKTTQLARGIQAHLRASRKHVTLIEVEKLNIHPCEGNISAIRGNNCGVPDARLKNKRKNPTGQHRCWASINNADDELYKITRELFKSECVVFFVSTRWGQTNSVYQRLFERLSWIENRISTLEKAPIPQLNNLKAGIVLFGHNWRGQQVLDTQKQNFKWFKFKTPSALSFHWQYTPDAEEEAPRSYLAAVDEFSEILQIAIPRAEEQSRSAA
jgi:multimeric flavodoxin WrbA